MAVNSKLAVRILMAPWDDTTGAFLDFLDSAKQSIVVSIYGFHLPRLTDLLIAKHQAGLKVSVILDHTQAEGKAEAGEVQKLLDAGVPLLIGTSPVHRQILHLKATVVDGERVTHGSWNYSLSASQQLNDLHFVEDAGVAAFYERHHDQVRSFIMLHEMTLQPQGETFAPAALPEDADVPAGPVESTSADDTKAAA